MRPCGWRLRLSGAAVLVLVLVSAAVASVRGAEEAAPAPAIVAEAPEPYISPTNGLGSWIWAEKTFDEQTCQLWRAIEIPAGTTVAKARLVMTVDNEFTLF